MDSVEPRGQTNATCCAGQTQIVEIKDLILNFKPIYPLPLSERGLAGRARMEQC